jgi:hypothetical protein
VLPSVCRTTPLFGFLIEIVTVPAAVRALTPPSTGPGAISERPYACARLARASRVPAAALYLPGQ